MDFNSKGLIEAAEKTGEARQRATATLTGATQEAALIATLNDAPTLEGAQTKVAEATAEAEKAALAHAGALDAVRNHLSQFPEDTAAAAYLAYADQKTAVAAKQMEMAEIPPDTGPEEIAKLELDLEAETMKLRDLRAAWKDAMPDR